LEVGGKCAGQVDICQSQVVPVGLAFAIFGMGLIVSHFFSDKWLTCAWRPSA
jgi:hypothetical protein